MTITIAGSGTITGASTLATTVASPTFTTPNIDSAQIATVSGTAPIYMCRAWVNFDGTVATPSTIRGSGNVSSITRNGTGDYTVNFTTSMPDVNYCSLATGTGQVGVSIDGYANIRDPATNKLVGSVRVQTIISTSTAYNSPNVNVTIFR